MFSKEIYESRRNALRSKVKQGIILLLGNTDSPINYPSNSYRFRQDSNFLYFFGIDRPGFVGLMDVEAGTDCIYANDISLDDIVWSGSQPSVKEIGEKVGVKKTFGSHELAGTLGIAIRNGRKIHFLPPYRDHNTLLLKSLLGIKTDCVRNYISTDLIKAIVSLREIKSSEEIEEIERACETGYLMHTEAMKMCRPGIVEREIAGTIEGIALSRGAGVSFLPIVTQEGQTLHNNYYGNKLKPGKLLLIDAGAESSMNYCSDFTRTLPVSGTFTSEQKDIYNIVLAANNKAQELIKGNVTYQSVHLEVTKTLSEGLREMGFMKGSTDDIVENGACALFMPHGLGHQLGLDTHDMEDLGEEYVGYNDQTERSQLFGMSSLRMGKKLKEGHVLTVEPGIYFIPQLIAKWKNDRINYSFLNYAKIEEFSGFGGVRLEDNVLVTAKGCRLLGKKRIPITVEDVEEAMRK